MQNKGFHKRGFISLLTALSFVAMTISGIVLYFAPLGRIAYWTDWKFALLTKTDWINIHILTSLLFAIGAIWHVWLNWKVFWSYIAGKIQAAAGMKKELVIAAVITIAFTFGPVYGIPPFSYVIDFGDYLKKAWITSSEYEPPFGHAEQLSLRALAKKTNIDLDKAVAELRQSGIRFDNTSESLEKIARANNKNAMQIFAVIKKFQKTDKIDSSVKFSPELVEERFAGTGIGRKTLKQVAEENGLDIEASKKKLAAKGISIKDDETFKDAATKYDIYPIDLMKIILVENYSPYSEAGGKK
ncbi:MAG: DUF4405 domain-containing protein [Nitrospiraceae bacterium]|nr:DUF4405 domain-containing protein [Nitrospiraceae bacterium]